MSAVRFSLPDFHPSRLLFAGGLMLLAVAVRADPLITTPPNTPMIYNDNPGAASALSDGASRNFRFPNELPPIFFPPIPPQLGASINTFRESQTRSPAPAELAPYVGEPFYAPLSTRLAKHSLRTKVQTRLEAYGEARLALLTELRGKLEALQGADPSTREHELAAFAKVQTPRVAALEKTADEIRADLVAGGFFEESADWENQREWHLGTTRFRTSTEAMVAQYQVMRAAVFYEQGLSPEQRRLLHEVAMELAAVTGQLIEGGEDTLPPPPSADSNPLLYFSPETARIRLPTELSPDLARKISDYEREKSALKDELRQTVYAEDKATFGFTRNRAFATLDDEQAPRLAALESLAEDIRRGLAQVPGYAQPPSLPSVPPAIITEITELVRARQVAQKSGVRLVRDIKAIVSVTRVDATPGPDGRARLSVVIDPQDRTEAKLKPVQEILDHYSEENRVRIAGMEKAKAVIHDQLVQFVGPRGDSLDVEQAVKELTDDALSRVERREEWLRYRDYRTAVLEPGLSPEQRRLLYSAGLEALDLLLPGADRPLGARNASR